MFQTLTKYLPDTACVSGKPFCTQKREKSMKKLHQDLFLLQDLKYRDFQAKLMPTIDKDTVIGIRIPELRKFASSYSKSADVQIFINALPHTYYEENNLHAFLIEKETDFDKCVELIDKFLPYVNNWATCDMMAPKVLGRNTDKLILEINKWIESEHTYTVRYAIGLLMKYYLEEKYKESYALAVARIRSGEYYINMMRAWYFATALAKRYDDILPFLTENRLDVWTHNKTIQKAVESYRITNAQKEYLKTLKRK